MTLYSLHKYKALKSAWTLVKYKKVNQLISWSFKLPKLILFSKILKYLSKIVQSLSCIHREVSLSMYFNAKALPKFCIPIQKINLVQLKLGIWICWVSLARIMLSKFKNPQPFICK